MTGRVPIARRALFQDRRRAALAAGGVAAALLLVMLLQGIFDGAMRQVTDYLRASPADVIVSEKGVRTMHMSMSALDPGTTAAVARVDGVAWAEPIRYTTTFVVAPDGGQQLSYVIGYDPSTGRGGPQRMIEGRPPAHGEIVLERIAADRLGLHIGDTVKVLNSTQRISGISRGGTTIINSIAYVTNDDFAAQRGNAIAYVLVGARRGVSANELADRLGAALPNDTVQTRTRFAGEEAAIVKDMSADVLGIMSTVGLLIALAVIALMLFTLTLAKLREHAVVKALGGSTMRLALVVLAQAAWLVLLSVALATILAIGLGAFIGRASPSITIAIEPARVLRIAAEAAVVGVFGALIPLRRVATVDPAVAFRRAS